MLDYAGEATYADNVEFVVGEGASLSVVSLQDWGPSSVHLSHQQALVRKDASHRAHVLCLWAETLCGMVPSVRYAGPGGEC